MSLETAPSNSNTTRYGTAGQSGNLSGRPLGSRTVLSQAFLKDLAELWSDEGS